MPDPALTPLAARPIPAAAAPLPVPAPVPLPACAPGAPPLPAIPADELDAGAPADAGDADAGDEDIGRMAEPNTDAGLPALDADDPPPDDEEGGTAELPDLPGSWGVVVAAASRAFTSSGKRFESCAAWETVGSFAC
ncbi:hypothetical protein [Mycolicibacterium sp. 120270]|uniref:hypothetical protein n=1 Tax=Mycolicibacterium sp. 120270 TaxID=3090600 RepID=UPI00299D21B6|nr:hypothetical protein [Mycolicibacterium sp. 120270]MDX1887872.1 hypothetical protein [Mycolicibacterium sp. 120270]